MISYIFRYQAKMWRCTGVTGMICQSFDTTLHYREEHNMVTEKRDLALLVILSERLQKQLYTEGRGPVSTNGLKNILWTDEAHITLEGAVNTQNSRMRGSTKPLVVLQRPLNFVYVTLWCGFTSTFIVGPYLF